MDEERLECGECGRVFGSEETLKKHSRIEHGSRSLVKLSGSGSDIELPELGRVMNASFVLGLLLGLLVAGAGFAGYSYWNSMDHRQPVKITVVTCDNCSYGKFVNATDRVFNARYDEVNYRSERGQKLIERYDLNYVPGFIFNKNVEKAENFYRVRHVLVEFEDAYVLPDKGNRAAQRLSSGKQLK